MNIKIIVAAHKKYRMPEDPMYLPLHVGAEGKKDGEGRPLDLGYTKDNTGDNISEKNPYFCELTGMYWAWKHLHADYIGLVHYRRYFKGRSKGKDPFDQVLTQKELEPLLSKYAVLVPSKRHYYIESLYSHYAHTFFAEHLDKSRDILQKLHPGYVPAFDKVMKQTGGYMFNMMILRSDLWDAYCGWLFSILFELEKQCPPDGLSPFHQRFYGRVSEILFNVWLRKQIESGALKKEEIKELPYIYMEKIDWPRKIFSFLMAKFFHVKYEKSF